MTFENALHIGDNLPILHKLAEEHAQSFHLLYVDPPYNTGHRFENYDDRQSSEAWLQFMEERVRAMKELLHPEGFLVVQIDDNEMAYLQLLLDRVMGRHNRRNTVVVKMSELSGVKMAHVEGRLPKLKEYLLVYGASSSARFRNVRKLKPEADLKRYLKYYSKLVLNPSSPVSEWEIRSIREVMKERGLAVNEASIRRFQLENRENVVYRTNNRLLSSLQFPTPTAEVISPKGVRYIWWEGKQMLFLADHIEQPLGDLWTDISTINLNKEGGNRFRNGKKPERLIRRIISLTTSPGQWVLDPFGGSGTTAAVAHMTGRRWVTIEEGPHAATHIHQRLRGVVEGSNTGGIRESIGWQGGGRFSLHKNLD